MKIAVDFQSAEGQRTGIGFFAKNLFDTISKIDTGIDFTFYTKNSKKDLGAPARIFWESVEIPVRNLYEKPDLIYSPGFSPALWSPVPRVVTVHDIIGVAFPSRQGKASKFYWSHWQPMVLKKAARIVASSESTRSDLEKYLGISPKKVEVVRLASGAHFQVLSNRAPVEAMRKLYDLPRAYWICVGTLEPRKNILNLVKAFEKFSQKRPETALVIVGKPGGAEGPIHEFIREKKLQKNIRILGYVSDENLVNLYNGALGYAMMSLYEGFGYPVLEAMSCGLSGIISDRSSLPEVAGKTAIWVNPEDVAEIADALATYTDDEKLRSTLAASAYLRSKEFSLEKTAQRMIEIFKETGGRL